MERATLLTRVVLLVTVAAAVAVATASDVGVDEDGIPMLFTEVETDARFPVADRVDRYSANCMRSSGAVCLGNASRTDGRGTFAAAARDALPLGLVGHWTFDDLIAQDQTGHMDALYPAPEFGPGMNGGSSAYFNGTALHWLSPIRTRSHNLSKKAATEIKYEKGGFNKKPVADNNRKKKETKKPKKKTAMNRASRAAIALSSTKIGGGVEPGSLATNPDGRLEDLTISFWVYLLSDVVGKFRTLIYRGDKEGATPHISLWPEIRRIHLRASTGYDPVTHAKTHITLDSHSAVLIGRWTHIAFVVQGTRLAQLYVNGLLDTQKLSLQPIRIHHSSDIMYLANNPYLPNSGIACYMDSVSIYNRALTRGQVTAIGSVSFPGLDAASVKLGCASCTLAMAANSCRASKGSHICSTTELNSGALLLARSMGWLSNLVSVRVYSADDLESGSTKPKAGAEPTEDQPQLGAGLCCRNT